MDRPRYSTAPVMSGAGALTEYYRAVCSEELERFNVHMASTALRAFSFSELAEATNNFAPELLLGEGGFGMVYKGSLRINPWDNGTSFVAVKQHDTSLQLQGDKEFAVEVLMLSNLQHPNIIKLIGYCTERTQKLLVYEFMEEKSLDFHLHGMLPRREESLSWVTRLKIIIGAAKGLKYLHATARPSVIYRDLKSGNVLLDKNFNPKLSDFGLAKFGPVGENNYVVTKVYGTYGYTDPCCQNTGHLTLKSDIYSFGVLLAEIITGREANYPNRPRVEGKLARWVRTSAELYYDQPRKLHNLLSDPSIWIPVNGFCIALMTAASCLQRDSSARFTADQILTIFQQLENTAILEERLTSTSPEAEAEEGSSGWISRRRDRKYTL